MSLLVGDALDKLGDKVAGQEGGFLALLGGLIPGSVQQLGTGSPIYQSGHQPLPRRWPSVTLGAGSTDTGPSQATGWW